VYTGIFPFSPCVLPLWCCLRLFLWQVVGIHWSWGIVLCLIIVHQRYQGFLITQLMSAICPIGLQKTPRLGAILHCELGRWGSIYMEFACGLAYLLESSVKKPYRTPSVPWWSRPLNWRLRAKLPLSGFGCRPNFYTRYPSRASNCTSSIVGPTGSLRAVILHCYALD
jgi:hypothetical protein